MFYREYLSKKSSRAAPFWGLKTDQGPAIIGRLQAIAQSSLAEKGTAAKLTIRFNKSSHQIELGCHFVEAVLGCIVSQVSWNNPGSPVQEYREHARNPCNYGTYYPDPEEELSDEDEESEFGVREMMSDELFDEPFEYRDGIGRFMVNYTYAWRVHESSEMVCDETFSLTGPLAKLDWNNLQFDWTQ